MMEKTVDEIKTLQADLDEERAIEEDFSKYGQTGQGSQSN
jgi:hypothetical protein